MNHLCKTYCYDAKTLDITGNKVPLVITGIKINAEKFAGMKIKPYLCIRLSER